jgi:hypothetical protein
MDGFDEDQMSPRAELGNTPPPTKSIEGVSGGDAAAGDNDNGDDDKPSAADADDADDSTAAAVVPPSAEGIKFYSRNDVICGRGGVTNVHPGNRRFRDLVNGNRLAYLKARKNDRPAISRSIVRTIREMNGRFLKKDDRRGVWVEIGDDCAREKTSQALRQRAPEIRKMLFDDELQQQQLQRAQQDTMFMQRHQDQLMMGIGMGQMGDQGMGQMGGQSMGQMGDHGMGQMGGQGMGGNGFPPMNMMGGGIGGSLPSMGAGNQLNVQGGAPDLSHQALFAEYNMLNNQKNWMSSEQNMILQQLAMCGMDPQGMIVPSQNNIDDMTTQTLLQQGMTSPSPQGA